MTADSRYRWCMLATNKVLDSGVGFFTSRLRESSLSVSGSVPKRQIMWYEYFLKLEPFMAKNHFKSKKFTIRKSRESWISTPEILFLNPVEWYSFSTRWEPFVDPISAGHSIKFLDWILLKKIISAPMWEHVSPKPAIHVQWPQTITPLFSAKSQTFNEGMEDDCECLTCGQNDICKI